MQKKINSNSNISSHNHMTSYWMSLYWFCEKCHIKNIAITRMFKSTRKKLNPILTSDFSKLNNCYKFQHVPKFTVICCNFHDPFFLAFTFKSNILITSPDMYSPLRDSSVVEGNLRSSLNLWVTVYPKQNTN